MGHVFWTTRLLRGAHICLGLRRAHFAVVRRGNLRLRLWRVHLAPMSGAHLRPGLRAPGPRCPLLGRQPFPVGLQTPGGRRPDLRPLVGRERGAPPRDREARQVGFKLGLGRRGLCPTLGGRGHLGPRLGGDGSTTTGAKPGRGLVGLVEEVGVIPHVQACVQRDLLRQGGLLRRVDGEDFFGKVGEPVVGDRFVDGAATPPIRVPGRIPRTGARADIIAVGTRWMGTGESVHVVMHRQISKTGKQRKRESRAADLIRPMYGRWPRSTGTRDSSSGKYHI